MKVNKKHNRLIVMCMILLICPLLAACPNAVDTDYIENGEYFRGIITAQLLGDYGASLKSENVPIVDINYQLPDGTIKYTKFTLDGFDEEKEIGYKLVLKKDKQQWEKNRKDGYLEAPDMNDAEYIQEAAVKYDFPIVFMWAYMYQDELSQGQINKNDKELRDTLKSILNKPEIIQWAQKGLYSGKWIKDGIEDAALVNFHIDFAHTDLPIVEIPYGDNNKAIFQIDGYDSQKHIGYKFVTAEDEAIWNHQRALGNYDAPDLSQFELIKQAAINFDFPVLFIFEPEYWKSTVSSVVNQNFYDLMRYKRIKLWLLVSAERG